MRFRIDVIKAISRGIAGGKQVTKVASHLHGQTGGFTSGLMVSKIQDWLISSRNRVYHLYNEISFIYRKTAKQT